MKISEELVHRLCFALGVALGSLDYCGDTMTIASIQNEFSEDEFEWIIDQGEAYVMGSSRYQKTLKELKELLKEHDIHEFDEIIERLEAKED